jgi:hypothetical protein
MTLIFYKQYFPDDYLIDDLINLLNVKFQREIKIVLFGFGEISNNYTNLLYVKKGCSDLDYQKIHLGNPIQFFYEVVNDEFNFKVSGIAIQGLSLGCSIFAPNKGFFNELIDIVENENTINLYEHNHSFIQIIDSLCIYLNSMLTISDKRYDESI